MDIWINAGKEKESVMKASKTVILWGREDMLGRGVGVFLNARKGWNVVRITDRHNTDFLMQEVERVKPDAVILYQGDYASKTNIPAQLITNYPNLKVITVSLENNTIEVYNKQKILVEEITDLFSIVEA